MECILLVFVVALLFSPHISSRVDVCGGCLLLSPYLRLGVSVAQKARFLSKVDPKTFHGIRSHSGYINVDEKHGSNLFFWFFPANGPLETTPWIIWLQGGPGVTSMLGLFELIGPFRIEDGKVKLRNVSWTSDYSVLFVDNPVGAGFSFTQSDLGYTNNEDDVGAQLLRFLQQFLLIFPELQQAPLFIAGQSYAGKYVPALAIKIHTDNSHTCPINLRGIAMGNAMVDPRNMMNHSRICSVLGILDDEEIDKLKLLEKATVKLTDEGRMVDAAQKFNETIEYIKKHSGVSVYNFRNETGKGYEAPAFETFLNREDIRRLIHVGNVTFDYNNQLVYEKMLPDIMNTTKPFVEQLLEHYGVMIYSGQLDIILGYGLARDTFKTLNWKSRLEYEIAPRNRVYDDFTGKIVAYVKQGGNFFDVLIRDAGHSVPSDQPAVAKFIIDNFIDRFK